MCPFSWAECASPTFQADSLSPFSSHFNSCILREAFWILQINFLPTGSPSAPYISFRALSTV